MTLEREAFDRLRSEGALFPQGIHQALIWVLGCVPGEDVVLDNWVPGAFEKLQAQVARAILAEPAAVTQRKAESIIAEALCEGDDEQYSVHVRHPRHAASVLAALVKHRVVRALAWQSTRPQ